MIMAIDSSTTTIESWEGLQVLNHASWHSLALVQS